MSREQDLAARVVAWLQAQRFDVYEEVQPPRCESRADIVGVRDGLSWIVECKTTLGLAVIRQADAWRGWAEYRSVAVPSPFRHSDDRYFAETLCRERGIGVLYVPARSAFDLSEKVSPTLDRAARRAGLMRDALVPEQKTGPKAGSTAGGHWTPFRATCRDLARIVRCEPGIPLARAIAQLPEGRGHYMSAGSARSSLFTLVQRGIVDGVRAEADGKRLLLYPTEATI